MESRRESRTTSCGRAGREMVPATRETRTPHCRGDGAQEAGGYSRATTEKATEMAKSLEESENTKGADVLYHKILKKNKGVISERMSRMNLGDRNVVVTGYPSTEATQLLHRALKNYDDTYDKAIH